MYNFLNKLSFYINKLNLSKGRLMLPSVLELYIVWHPGDAEGEGFAGVISEYFKGTKFTGLISGAIEVYVRSEGWTKTTGAPRQIPSTESPPPNGIPTAKFTAVIPLLGLEMAKAVEKKKDDEWYSYIENLVKVQRLDSQSVKIFPYVIDNASIDRTKLGELVEPYQQLANEPTEVESETTEELLCRDLSQGLSQFLAPKDKDRLKVFISHTKKALPESGDDSLILVEDVRSVIANTRLAAFFDASDIQVGDDWEQDLVEEAGSCALLCLRTDLYSSRIWCQYEMLIAKRKGMPIVVLDALFLGEERGSFIMDHLPRLPMRKQAGNWCRSDIVKGLRLLVDESLKKYLWGHQESLLKERMIEVCPRLGVENLLSLYFDHNEVSKRINEKLGFRTAGHLTEIAEVFGEKRGLMIGVLRVPSTGWK